MKWFVLVLAIFLVSCTASLSPLGKAGTAVLEGTASPQGVLNVTPAPIPIGVNSFDVNVSNLHFVWRTGYYFNGTSIVPFNFPYDTYVSNGVATNWIVLYDTNIKSIKASIPLTSRRPISSNTGQYIFMYGCNYLPASKGFDCNNDGVVGGAQWIAQIVNVTQPASTCTDVCAIGDKRCSTSGNNNESCALVGGCRAFVSTSCGSQVCSAGICTSPTPSGAPGLHVTSPISTSSFTTTDNQRSVTFSVNSDRALSSCKIFIDGSNTPIYLTLSTSTSATGSSTVALGPHTVSFLCNDTNNLVNDSFTNIGFAVSRPIPSDYTGVSNCAGLQGMSGSTKYMLGNNIDCSGVNFIPIGTSAAPFTGVLDGNGFKIMNLVINRPTSEYVGLFGYTGANAKITSLFLDKVFVKGGTNYVGGLVGYASDTLINQSVVSGLVLGNTRVGSMAGYALTSVIQNSYSLANVTGTSYVGGLVGTLDSSKINSSYFIGNVSGTSQVGGLAGKAIGSVIIQSSFAAGKVVGSSATGAILGEPSTSTVFISNYWENTRTGQSVCCGITTPNTPTDTYCTSACTGYSNTATTSTVNTDFFFRKANLPGFNFNTVWNICDWQSYPFLRWEARSCDYVPLGFTAVSKCNQLQNIDFFKSGRYFLINDIDCTGVVFTPISDFRGEFNGGNHVINKLSISSGSINNVGLFGSTQNGVNFSNLIITNANIVGSSYVGCLAGQINSAGTLGSIVNVSCSGSVKGYGTVGGLVGLLNSALIKSSFTDVNVSNTASSNYYGGLVGQLSANSLVSSCYSRGNVTGYNYAGGLVGINYGHVNSSYSMANVSCYSSCSGGGLVGYNYNTGIIRNSFSAGKVPSSGGGLVGNNYAASVIDSYWDVLRSGNTNCCTGSACDGCYAINTLASPMPNHFFSEVNVREILRTSIFDKYWAMCSNNYPFLKWQNVVCPTMPGVTITSPIIPTAAINMKRDFNVSLDKPVSSCTISFNNFLLNLPMTLNGSNTGANYSYTFTSTGTHPVNFSCVGVNGLTNNTQGMSFLVTNLASCGSGAGNSSSVPVTANLCGANEGWTEVTGDGITSPWSWSCINGGSSVPCTSYKNAACGTANTVSSSVSPSQQLCGVGVNGSVTLSGSTWSWTCKNGIDSNVITCTAPKVNEPVATCGSANNINVSVQPSVSSALCAAGSYGAIVQTAVNYTWQCTLGSSSTSCVAYKNAACGDAHGQGYIDAPPQNLLCRVGVDGGITSFVGAWGWYCTNVLSTNKIQCSSPKTNKPILTLNSPTTTSFNVDTSVAFAVRSDITVSMCNISFDGGGSYSTMMLDFDTFKIGTKSQTFTTAGTYPVKIFCKSTNLVSSDYTTITLTITNPAPVASCGNNLVETGEVCDGTSLTGKTCRDFDTKNIVLSDAVGLRCYLTGSNACKYDFTGCTRRFHSADYDHNNTITEDELALVYSYNDAGSYHCDPSTLDGFAEGPGSHDCITHSADYKSSSQTQASILAGTKGIPDWKIDSAEVSRVGGLASSYSTDASSFDGFKPFSIIIGDPGSGGTVP